MQEYKLCKIGFYWKLGFCVVSSDSVSLSEQKVDQGFYCCVVIIVVTVERKRERLNKWILNQ